MEAVIKSVEFDLTYDPENDLVNKVLSGYMGQVTRPIFISGNFDFTKINMCSKNNFSYYNIKAEPCDPNIAVSVDGIHEIKAPLTKSEKARLIEIIQNAPEAGE